MTVNITFSSTPGGYSMTDTQDSGTATPTTDPETIAQDIYIRHDADIAPITNCSWYIQRCVSVNYEGSDADTDLTEILAWGATSGYGFMINQEGNGAAAFESFYANHGTVEGQITLPITAVITGTPAGAGQIPVAGEAKVQVKWKVPASIPRGSGTRGLSLVFAYSATS